MEAFQIISVFELHISQILYESAICNDFLDEKFPDHPLNPKDPYRKARQRILLERWGKVLTVCLYLYESTMPPHFIQEHSPSMPGRL